jgi:hypothetical protein
VPPGGKSAELDPNLKLINPLNTQLNPICHLLALLGVRHILHVSRIRVKTQPVPSIAFKFIHLVEINGGSVFLSLASFKRGIQSTDLLRNIHHM